MTGPKYLCARLLCVPGLDQVRPSRGLRLEQRDRHLCLLPSVAIARRVEPPAALVRQQPSEELTREQRRVLLPRQVVRVRVRVRGRGRVRGRSSP